MDASTGRRPEDGSLRRLGVLALGLVALALSSCARRDTARAGGAVADAQAVASELVLRPSTAPAPAPPADAATPCGRDAEAETEVASRIVQLLEPKGRTPQRRYEVDFSCASEDSAKLVIADRVEGLSAHGHGGDLSLGSLSLDPNGGGQVIVFRFRRHGAAPKRAAGTERRLDVARVAISAAEGSRQIALVRAALSADVRPRSPQPVPEMTRHSVSVDISTHDQRLAIRLGVASQDVAEKHWQGYVNSLEEPKRVPLEVAWQAAFAVDPGAFKPATASAVSAEEKALIERWSTSDGGRSDWVADELRALVAAAADAR